MLRKLAKSDLNQILFIEQAVHVSPWTEETFNTCFQSGYIGWVIEEQHKIIAFVMISLRDEECHILNLCVLHEYQHQGHGKHLMQHALKQAKQMGADIAYLEVRRSNSRAINLYTKLHFQLIGERKNYYPTVSGQEDALVFGKTLLDVF